VQGYRLYRLAEQTGTASGQQQMSKPLKRTSFRYDMMPWKLVFCSKTWADCGQGTQGPSVIPLSSLPPAPEPGRIPEGCDHVHVEPKLSADQRNAREEEKWHALLMGTSRCEHGRIMRDPCRQCPKGRAPDLTGKRVGTANDGEAIVIPEYEDMIDPKAWVPNRKRKA
jgi:hypothetical protein